ncbi:Tetratricopeptide repeat-containing protein [Mucilaginibacter pineti]|uniref:Tetratricopeptide repeat-containing protein n=1 Tax=Mucilaginibacter pineti TaxID=1391627 RepID=A0A1G7AMN6_9SPHI|nr:tetratricopeptide repeat protein [Mucilaginibacter pineti]SDE15275.1 Tetratricopeptide repeat-containing protein [Mucilaginibacter pineti]
MKLILPALILLFFTSNAICQTTIDFKAIGDSLFRSADYNGAIVNYTQGINNVKNDKSGLAELLDKRALAELRLEQHDKVIADETAAIAENPILGDAYWNRGLAYARTEKYQLAIDDYNKAILTFKGDNERQSKLYDNLGLSKAELKLYKDAIDAYNQALSLNSKNGKVYWHRAIAFNGNKDYQLAIDDYTMAMFYNQENTQELATLYDNRGLNKRSLKKYREALNDFNTALRLNPQRGTAYWHRAYTYHLNSDHQLAINDYTTAIPFYKNSKEQTAQLLESRSVDEIAAYQPQKAIDDVTSAIELYPKNGFTYWTRANIYAQTGNYKLSIDDYNKTMEFFKDNKKVLCNLHADIASDLYITKDNKNALKECNTSIELYPDFCLPYFTRGKLYLKRLENKDLAIKDFNKVLELDTTKSTVAYIFSQFYLGHADTALGKLQENILKISNSDDLIRQYYNFACLYSLLNKPQEANIYLKKAVDAGYSKSYAADDEDFDNIRKTPDYIALMANLGH